MKILIVTPDGVLRNSALREALPGAEVFSGYDGRSSNLQDHPKINQDSNEVVISRRLSSTQAGAVLSHNKAQSISEGNWTCILEDDAVVLDSSVFYEGIAQIKRLKYKEPTIILLYSGYGGVYGKFRLIGKSFSLGKVLSLPTGAVGYVINNACKNMVLGEFQITGGPDWPTWSSKVDFFQLYPPIIFHSSNHKSIYMELSMKTDSINWPKHRQSTVGAFTSLFSLKILKSYGGLKSYFKIVILSGLHRKLNH